MKNVRRPSIPRLSRHSRVWRSRPRGRLAIEYVGRLENALIEALEQCWEGKLPFQTLERAVWLRLKP